jgi:hypothetical protein
LSRCCFGCWRRPMACVPRAPDSRTLVQASGRTHIGRRRSLHRRLGDDGSSGRLGGNGRSGRHRGHHKSWLLARLGNDSPGRRWRRRSKPLRSLLTPRAWRLHALPGGRSLPGKLARRARRHLSGRSRRSLDRQSLTRAGLRQRWRGLSSRGSGSWRRDDAGGARQARLTGGLRWRGQHGHKGSRWSRLRFFFSPLNCLQHVAWLRHTRPVDLRLGIIVAPGRDTAVFATAVKVDAHPLGFVSFERT